MHPLRRWEKGRIFFRKTMDSGYEKSTLMMTNVDVLKFSNYCRYLVIKWIHCRAAQSDLISTALLTSFFPKNIIWKMRFSVPNFLLHNFRSRNRTNLAISRIDNSQRELSITEIARFVRSLDRKLWGKNFGTKKRIFQIILFWKKRGKKRGTRY